MSPRFFLSAAGERVYLSFRFAREHRALKILHLVYEQEERGPQSEQLIIEGEFPLRTTRRFQRLSQSQKVSAAKWDPLQPICSQPKFSVPQTQLIFNLTRRFQKTFRHTESKKLRACVFVRLLIFDA